MFRFGSVSVSADVSLGNLIRVILLGNEDTGFVVVWVGSVYLSHFKAVLLVNGVGLRIGNGMGSRDREKVPTLGESNIGGDRIEL